MQPARRFATLTAVLVLAGCGGSSAPSSPPSSPPAPPAAPDLVPADDTTDTPTLRLPDTAEPVRYALDLRVLPEKGTFDGSIDIELRVDEPTATLWLNARELEVHSASLIRGDETLEARAEPVGTDFLRIDLPRAIASGPARLRITYAGTMDDERTQGIYRAREPDGHWYAYTKFESIDGRAAFPHFDEPGYKVPWQLTFRVPEGNIALANAPIVERATTDDGLVTIVTAESRPMPSYLVAFVVGPFEVVDAGTAGNHDTPLRFIIPQGRGDELAYALESTPRLVGLLEDYFGTKIPYRKLDVAVVPRYWGTMEHPGIVALGQPLTLIAPDEDSPDRRKHYANIAIHELCHYWFGDYVTMHWWDDAWLNEAFGTWCDQKITHQLEPSWEWDVGSVWWRNWALSSDAMATAKAVRAPAETTEDIENAFDAVTYFKGAAVIGMFEDYVGADRFRDFIRTYLDEHAWKTATTESHVAIMNRELDGLGDAMRTFIDEPGAPLVTLDLDCEDGPRLALRQQRYVPLGSELDAAGQWQVPVCVRFGGEGWDDSACWLLTEDEQSFALADAPSCPSWVVANRNGTGYYRARHGEGLDGNLQRALPRANLRERIAMVSDLEALVDAGLADPARALALAPRLAREADDNLVLSGSSIIRSMDVHVPDALRPRYARFVRRTFGSRARALGWTPEPGETTDDRELRPALLYTVARYGNGERLVREAVKRARQYASGEHDISDDMVGTVLGVAALGDDDDLFATLLAAARDAEDRRRRSRLFAALGRFPGEDHARRALAITLDPELDMRETRGILSAVAGQRELDDVFWSFIQEHFDELAPRMTNTYVPRYLVSAATWTCEPERIAQLRTFYADRVDDHDGAAKALEEGIEGIRLCAAARKAQRPAVLAFLRDLPAR